MELNLLRIDELLNMPKSVIRRANEKDVLNIKNELLMLLNGKNAAYKPENIRQLINEIQFLNVYVVKDNQDKIIYSYDPPKSSTKRVTIKESGWIEIDKK